MKTAVIIPNLNGEAYLRECIDSLLSQSVARDVVVIENASTDTSQSIIDSYGEKIICLNQSENLGFAGGVNVGIKYAIDNGYLAVALFNNDAVAEKTWLEELQKHLNDRAGIVTGYVRSIDRKTVDTAGEEMTMWGLPHSRGRGKLAADVSFNKTEEIFGAFGGATLYSVAMLKDIGLFDERYFAYYEDLDISYRAQLAGWKVIYTPNAHAYHHVGMTSSRMKKGFTVYQAFKNLPMLVGKNTPSVLLWQMLPRFGLAYVGFFINALLRGDIAPATKGVISSINLLPHTIRERKKIQTGKKVSDEYIESIITHELPPSFKDKLQPLAKFRRGKFL